MKPILYDHKFTEYENALLVALICEKNGFWPGVIIDEASGHAILVNYRFIPDGKAEYCRECCDIASEIYELYALAHEDAINKFKESNDEELLEYYSTCHIELSINYELSQYIFKIFIAHDNDYDDRIVFAQLFDIAEICDVVSYLF